MNFLMTFRDYKPIKVSVLGTGIHIVQQQNNSVLSVFLKGALPLKIGQVSKFLSLSTSMRAFVSFEPCNFVVDVWGGKYPACQSASCFVK